jgi:hypothetical protein
MHETVSGELYIVERMLGSEQAMPFSARNPVISPNGLIVIWLKINTKPISHIAGLIPQILQLQAHVKLASLGSYHKSEECTKSCTRTSVCYCNQSGGGASIRLLT